MHILRRIVNENGQVVHYQVGHWTPVTFQLQQIGDRSVQTSKGGDFEVLASFGKGEENEAAAWVNYLNGGMGIHGPVLDFIAKGLAQAIADGKV
jgi:hypothetical protein